MGGLRFLLHSRLCRHGHFTVWLARSASRRAPRRNRCQAPLPPLSLRDTFSHSFGSRRRGGGAERLTGRGLSQAPYRCADRGAKRKPAHAVGGIEGGRFRASLIWRDGRLEFLTGAAWRQTRGDVLEQSTVGREQFALFAWLALLKPVECFHQPFQLRIQEKPLAE